VCRPLFSSTIDRTERIAVLTFEPVDADIYAALTGALEASGLKATLVPLECAAADRGRRDHQAVSGIQMPVEPQCFDGLIVFGAKGSRMPSSNLSGVVAMIADANNRRKPIIAIGAGGKALLNAAGVQLSGEPENRVWCANSFDADFTLLMRVFIHAKPNVGV
jgi:CTP synthase (UTP-ammonia lyase)